MKNKIIPSIPKNMQSDNLHSKVSMQESDEKKSSKKSSCIKSITPALLGMYVSLMILIIPFAWLILCMICDENNQADFEPSDLNEPIKLSSDFFQRSSDRFGYHVVGKIPEYRIPSSHLPFEPR